MHELGNKFNAPVCSDPEAQFFLRQHLGSKKKNFLQQITKRTKAEILF